MSAAKLFHVTPRTVQNWRAGSTRPSGAVLRLLRLLAGRHLAAPGWEGWRFHSGKLWTPEGHAIGPSDGNWWSLLVRQARGFRAAYEELHVLRNELARVWRAGLIELVEAPASAAEGVPGTGAFGGEAVSRACLSINKSNRPDAAEVQGQLNQGLTQSDITVDRRYQTDHNLISPCPIPSASPPFSMPKLARSASAPASASMGSLPSPLTPISEVQAPRQSPRSSASSQRARRQQQPLKGRDQSRVAAVAKSNSRGERSTTPTCGPTSIPSLRLEGKPSIRTMKQPASSSNLSTGPRGKGRMKSSWTWCPEHPAILGPSSSRQGSLAVSDELRSARPNEADDSGGSGSTTRTEVAYELC
jgi:hypothetical protein